VLLLMPLASLSPAQALHSGSGDAPAGAQRVAGADVAPAPLPHADDPSTDLHEARSASAIAHRKRIAARRLHF
jgi:hypothetical protein